MGTFEKAPGLSKLIVKRRNLVVGLAACGTLAVTGAATATGIIGSISHDQTASHSSMAGEMQCHRWIDMMTPKA